MSATASKATGASIKPAAPAAALYRWAGFAAFPTLVQGCSTRHRPTGLWGPAGDWNLKRRGADPVTAEANWVAFVAAVGCSAARMVAPEQVHGTGVAVVTAADAGLGTMAGNRGMVGMDALVTRTPGLLLLCGSADCVPVAIYDPQTPAVGLAHAGWQGTAEQIAARTVAAMQTAFGSDPAACHAVLGPSIGPCCYEVKGTVIEAIRDAYPAADDEWQGEPPLLIWSRRRAAWQDRLGLPHSEPDSDEKVFLDLWQANRRALLLAGVPGANIHIEGVCTAEHTDRFYSHRAEAGAAGRFVAFLGLPDGG